MTEAGPHKAREAAFWAAALCVLHPAFSGGVALAAGIAAAVALGTPRPEQVKALGSRLLAWSIVALGAGMNLVTVAQVGARGFGYTVVGIAGTLLVGLALGRALCVPANAGTLISVGTAICGGSAIAAAAPAIRAKPEETSLAVATVFLLNAAALFLFPPLGRALGLSQGQFGLWSALAIHDTSSVVAAALQYGPRAAEIATTVKLARALWIVPVTFLAGWIHSGSGEEGKARRPWFILGFVCAAAAVTWAPGLRSAGLAAASGGRRLLCLALFMTGAGIRPDALRRLGPRPFAQGVLLWILSAAASLAAIRGGWASL